MRCSGIWGTPMKAHELEEGFVAENFERVERPDDFRGSHETLVKKETCSLNQKQRLLIKRYNNPKQAFPRASLSMSPQRLHPTSVALITASRALGGIEHDTEAGLFDGLTLNEAANLGHLLQDISERAKQHKKLEELKQWLRNDPNDEE